MDADLEQMLLPAYGAVSYAQDVRTLHRLRSSRSNRQRQQDIQVATARLKRVMGPIRSELARIPYKERKDGSSSALSERKDELARASKAVQRERRKLWKMQERKEAHHGKRGRGR